MSLYSPFWAKYLASEYKYRMQHNQYLSPKHLYTRSRAALPSLSGACHVDVAASMSWRHTIQSGPPCRCQAKTEWAQNWSSSTVLNQICLSLSVLRRQSLGGFRMQPMQAWRARELSRLQVSARSVAKERQAPSTDTIWQWQEWLTRYFRVLGSAHSTNIGGGVKRVKTRQWPCPNSIRSASSSLMAAGRCKHGDDITRTTSTRGTDRSECCDDTASVWIPDTIYWPHRSVRRPVAQSVGAGKCVDKPSIQCGN